MGVVRGWQYSKLSRIYLDQYAQLAQFALFTTFLFILIYYSLFARLQLAGSLPRRCQ